MGNDEMAIASIGGFLDWRDQATTLRATARLKRQGYKLRPVFIGGGPGQCSMMSLAAELGLANEAIFTGRIGGAAELLPGMDLYVNAAYAEGFGIATVEALLCSLPVVACDAGANSEVLDYGRRGLLFRQSDSDDLAAALSRLLDDQGLRAHFAGSSREYALRAFAPERLAKDHDELCLRLVSSS